MSWGTIGLTLFLGLFLAVGLGLLFFGSRSLHLAKQAESWPTAQGEVTARDFKINSDDDGTTYRAEIKYSYSVLGQNYDGDHIAFGYSGSSARQFHRDLLDALPVGASIAVRYDPESPERAVLSHGMNKSILFLLIFGCTWTVFTLGIASLFFLSEGGANTLLSNITVYSRPN